MQTKFKAIANNNNNLKITTACFRALAVATEGKAIPSILGGKFDNPGYIPIPAIPPYVVEDTTHAWSPDDRRD